MSTFLPILGVVLVLYFLFALYQNVAIVLPKVNEIWECPQENLKIICTRVEGRHVVCTMYHNDRIIEDVHIGKAFCSYDASYKDVVEGKEQIVGAFAGNFLFRTSDYLYIRGNMDGEKGKHIMKFFIS